MKKARQPILFLICSLSSFLFEYLLLFLLEYFFGAWMGEFTQKVIARLISSFYNFNMNNWLVFSGDEPYGKKLAKYYCLVVPSMLISAGLLKLVAVWTRIDELTAGYGRFKAAALHTLINAPVDIVMMVVNFLVQKYWVFVRKKK
jgi:putative flippase GtrA